MSIMVHGNLYKTLCDFGWQTHKGKYTKEVETSDGPRMAEKERGGEWKWAKHRPITLPAKRCSE